MLLLDSQGMWRQQAAGALVRQAGAAPSCWAEGMGEAERFQDAKFTPQNLHTGECAAGAVHALQRPPYTNQR